ncbi:class I SAM-dependent methyltransferase [Aureispira anguillae]|uniref:Class I SAM-dependent methyltransferase n=1 Tax=Aureispira anguillae TaxID=2864201 RepID=A0A915YEC1_9BACT|nr:class I SAM-dependent methyltransferase [Aureispira anguillae]BDS11558.1 class I SAM-dependent methyltransferase [Aureispira anguillae]
MTREQKKIYRADLFQHLDGIVTAPTAYALYKKGVLDLILAEKSISLSKLTQTFRANEGYLNIALHTLASQGWLRHTIKADNEIEIATTALSELAFKYIPKYKDVVELLQISGKYHPRKFELEPFLFLESIFKKYSNNYGLELSNDEKQRQIQRQVLKHIEGIIVGPTVVALGMSGMFHNYFMEASFQPEEFHKDGASFGRLLDFFVFLNWFEKKNQTYRFTEKGMFYARRASAYGVTVSYIPMFRKVEELIFGDPEIFWRLPKNAKEIHVDRTMNVWGSGGAHAAYFKVVDKIIIDLFNQPIEQQPKGIVDMGCGNGAFLIHLYEVIEQRTIRGKLLEEYPLFLVGADFNQAALNVTRTNIIQANIWAKLIWGDIGRPDLLAKDLEENYGIQLKDLLNVRTFLDHNRIWSKPIDNRSPKESSSTGAYAFRGQRISTTAVENNLREHLTKWSPYVEKYGLLLIELHTIPPALAASNLGKTAATAYNATHGFSDQYIVEVDIFNKIAEEAGLFPDKNHFTKFPNSDIATVSINLLKKDTNQ